MSQADFNHLLEILPDLSPEQLELLRLQLDSQLSVAGPLPSEAATGQGMIGALREDAALLHQAVEHVMRVREERPWRLPAGE